MHLCLSKLPSDLKSRFERRFGEDPIKLPTFDHLITFLEDECRHHDNVGSASVVDATTRPTVAPPRFVKPNTRSLSPPRAFVTFATVPKCYFCDSTAHYIRDCPDFAHLPTRQRVDMVREARLCYRCLDQHAIANCKRNYRCQTCRRPSHHSLLCYDSAPPINNDSFRNVAVYPSNHSRQSSSRRLMQRVSPPRRLTERIPFA